VLANPPTSVSVVIARAEALGVAFGQHHERRFRTAASPSRHRARPRRRRASPGCAPRPTAGNPAPRAAQPTLSTSRPRPRSISATDNVGRGAPQGQTEVKATSSAARTSTNSCASAERTTENA
jgi:hypothetical protein